MDEVIIPITFELRALDICYAGLNKKYFKMETPMESVVFTSSETYDDIYNGTEYQLLNSGFRISVEDISIILGFIEDNQKFIEDSIKELRGEDVEI